MRGDLEDKLCEVAELWIRNKSWDIAMKILLAFVCGAFFGYFWFALRGFAKDVIG